MNIHEHQSKELLKKYGIPVPEGFVIFNKSEISKKLTKNLNQTLVIKAQIHAGGRGKAGGIKIVKNLDEAVREANIMLDKIKSFWLYISSFKGLYVIE